MVPILQICIQRWLPTLQNYLDSPSGTSPPQPSKLLSLFFHPAPRVHAGVECNAM